MNREIIKNEIQYKAVRSSGAGGQHVNKVASKVVVTWAIAHSEGISSNEKEVLLTKLANKISKEGLFIIESSETRSQHKNKEIGISRLFALLERALQREKKRIPTKTPKSVIRKRLEDKQRNSEKKQNRKFKLF